MAAGSIIIDLLMRTGSFVTDTQRASNELKKFKKEAVEQATEIKEAFIEAAALFGVSIGAEAFVELIKGSIEAADHLNDLSKQTGIAVETLGGIGFAASQAGGNLESATAAAGKLNKALAEAASGNQKAGEAFKALGIDVKDASGKTLSADDALEKIAERFEQFADGPEKTALALRLFGKAGADMIPILDDGAAALRENIEFYKQYSGVTAEVAKQSDEFNDQVGKLKLLTSGLATTVAAELLPVLKDLVDAFLELKTQGGGFKGTADDIVTVLKAIIFVAAEVAHWFADDARALGALVAEFDALAHGDGKAVLRIRAEFDIDDKQAQKEFDAFIAKLQGSAATSEEHKFVGPPAPAKPPAPRLPDEGDTAKALAALKASLAAQIKAIQDFAADEQSTYQFANRLVDGTYADGLESLASYFQQQKALRAAALQVTTDELDAEIKAYEAARPKLIGADRIENESKIAQAVSARSKAVQKAAQDDILASQAEARQAKALADSYAGLLAQVADLQGNHAGADAIRNAQQIQQVQELVTRAGGSQQTVVDFSRLITQTTQLKELQTDYNNLLGQDSAEQEKIQLDAQASGASEFDTLEKLHAEREKTLQQLGQLAAEAQALADALNTPEAIAFATQLANAFKKATAEVDPLLSKIRDVAKDMGDTIANSFEDAVIEGKSLRETLQGIAKDIGRIVIHNLVTVPLANDITNALGGTGQSGGFLGWLLGKGSSTSPAGGATQAAQAGQQTEQQAQQQPGALSELWRLFGFGGQGGGQQAQQPSALGPYSPPGAPGGPSAAGALAAVLPGQAANDASIAVSGLGRSAGGAAQALDTLPQVVQSIADAVARLVASIPSAGVGQVAGADSQSADDGLLGNLNDLFSDSGSDQGSDVAPQQDAQRQPGQLAAGFGGASGAGVSSLVLGALGAAGGRTGEAAGLLGSLGGPTSGLGAGFPLAAILGPILGFGGPSSGKGTDAANDATAAVVELGKAASGASGALGGFPALLNTVSGSVNSLVQALFASDTSGSGGGGGLLGLVGSLFGGSGSGGSGGSAGGSTAGDDLSFLADDSELFAHTGGVVGRDKLDRGARGPLRTDERRAVLKVGEEVLTRDDPRHRDNMRFDPRFHDGGVVGQVAAGAYRPTSTPSWIQPPAANQDPASMRPIQIVQNFPSGTTRATTDQAAAQAGAAVRRANARIR